MYKKIRSAYHFLDLLYCVIIFGAVFITAHFLQFNSQNSFFLGEDSFYHVAIAKYMTEHGLIIHHFPYLNFTSLNEKFVDWGFLFHVLLIPFIKVFGEIIGPKILVMMILSLIFCTVYFIFKQQRLKYAFLYTLILFFIMPAPFYARMSLIRAPVLSLLFLVLSIYFFFRKKPLALSIFLFLYVWSYFLGAAFVVFLIISYFIILLFRKEKIDYKFLIYPLFGFILGLILNPFFPQNISFYLLIAGVVNSYRIYAGSELLPPGAWQWFYSSIIIACLYLGSIFFSLLKNIKQNSQVLSLLIFSIFLLILQWKSSRFVEYWPLIAGITAIVLIGPYLEDILSKVRKNWRKMESIIVVALLLVFTQESMIHGTFELSDAKKNIQTDPRVLSFSGVGQFLENNSKEGDIVFTRWDYFSYLFYFDKKNYYVIGLEPALLEKYDKKLNDEYLDLFFNPDSQTNLEVIKNDFKSKWVVTYNPLGPTAKKIDERKDLFEKAYENDHFVVFKVL